MSAINEQIAREYVEAHGFFVRQPHKYVVMARNKRPSEEIDLIIVKPAQTEHEVPADILWTGRHLSGIARAVVSVRGWHTERISVQALQNFPQLFRFAMPDAVASVRSLIGDAPVARIICLPDLPTAIDYILKRSQSSKIHWVGHSMGGMLATRFALDYRERTAKLILLNPIGLEDYLLYTRYPSIDATRSAALRRSWGVGGGTSEASMRAIIPAAPAADKRGMGKGNDE